MNPIHADYERRLRRDLPPPLAELAVSRLDESFCVFGHPVPSPEYGPLMNGFSWGSTPEGRAFWRDVHNHLAYGIPEELPSMKELTSCTR